MFKGVKVIEESFIGTAGAAQFLGKPQSWLHNNAEGLGMPRYRIGNQYRYLKSELTAWLKGELHV